MTREAVTSTVPVARADFRPAIGLGWLVGFGAFGVSLSGLYAATGRGFGCPFKMATGWDCPLCGGTRLGAALLHGDVAAAFGFNQVVFVGLLLLAGLGLVWLVELAGGPRVRPPAAWRARLLRISPTTWLLVGLGLAAVWTVARNLLL